MQLRPIAERRCVLGATMRHLLLSTDAGGRRTNATFVHSGTRAVAPQTGGAPRRLDYWSGLQRLGVEGAAAATVAGAWWFTAQGHGVGVWRALVAAACIGAAVCGWCAASRALAVRMRREVLWPLAGALAPLAGRHEGENPARWIRFPARWDHPDNREPVRIRLHHGFLADAEDDTDTELPAQLQVRYLVAAKLRTADLSYTWNLGGRSPEVLVRRGLHPPGRVTFDDAEVLELAEAAPESAQLIGLGTERRPYRVDLDVDSPHVLIAGGSGCGKSVFVEALMAGGLRLGWAASVLDRKLVSQRWLRGIDGVDYWRTIPTMHEGLVALGGELARRMAVVDAWPDDTDPDVGPRHVVLVEEAPSITPVLRDYWDATRCKGGPKRSPALAALHELGAMGRQFRMHLMTTAQQGSVAAVGSGQLRENFAVRALARATVNQWRMLCPQVSPPAPSRHPGRWHVVVADQVASVQVLYLGDPERMANTAREWATSGVRPVSAGPSPAWQAYVAGELPEGGPFGGVALGPVPAAGAGVPAVEAGTPQLELVPSGSRGELLTLSQAVTERVVGPTLEAVRAARKRDPEFPRPAGVAGTHGGVEDAYLYRRGELAIYGANRQRAPWPEGEPA